MRRIDSSRYRAAPGERITVEVISNRPPSLVSFSDARGSQWEILSHTDRSAERSFMMPSSGEVAFEANFDTVHDDIGQTTYHIAISGTTGGRFTETIVVGPEAPVTMVFSFETDYPGPR
jgi:hypothetical protein